MYSYMYTTTNSFLHFRAAHLSYSYKTLPNLFNINIPLV